jgi:hypothetical protein
MREDFDDGCARLIRLTHRDIFSTGVLVKQIKTHRSTINIHSLSGTIKKYNQFVETKVSGSGGGGAFYKGTGDISDINISTSHTLRREIFLESDDGRLHPLKLTGWEDFMCMEGNKISLVWIIEKGMDSGDYVYLKNHTTGRGSWWKSGVGRHFKFPMLRILKWTTGISSVIGFFIGGITVSMIFFVVFGLIGGLIISEGFYDTKKAYSLMYEIEKMT